MQKVWLVRISDGERTPWVLDSIVKDRAYLVQFGTNTKIEHTLALNSTMEFGVYWYNNNLYRLECRVERMEGE